MIRAGEDASALPEMRQAGVIALRYPQIQVDARTIESTQIEALIKDSGRTQPGVRRVRLEWFANDMSISDLLVIPDAKNHEVWFAVVTGEYQYDPSPPVAEYFHWREVNWLGAMDRDLLDEPHRRAISVRPSLVQDLDLDWWRKMSESETVHAGGLPTKKRASRVGVAREAKPLVDTRVACSNSDCRMQFSPTLMIDGLCPDCHASL